MSSIKTVNQCLLLNMRNLMTFTVKTDTTVHTTPGQGTMEILTFVGFAGNLSVFSHGQGVKVLDCTLAILGCWAVSGTVNSNQGFSQIPRLRSWVQRRRPCVQICNMVKTLAILGPEEKTLGSNF